MADASVRRVLRTKLRPDRGKRLIMGAGFLAVATQRFGFGNDGAIQATTLVSLAIVLCAIFVGRQKISPSGLLLFCLLIVVGTISLIGSAGSSISSLILLLATYSPILLGRTSREDFGELFMRGAVIASVIGALMGVIQYIVQSSGHGFIDPVRSLPPALLRSGFNSYYGIDFFYGSATAFKPNGVIFLEPSFLSLYSAVGLVYILVRIFSKAGTWRWWHIAAASILGCGFAASASASGVVVLIFAAIPLAVRALTRIRLLIAMSVLVGVLFSVGLFNAVVEKTADTAPGSSAALRLFAPYTTLVSYWQKSPIIGLGPGSTTDIITRLEVDGLQASTMMKALVEYGLIGWVVILAIVCFPLARSRAPVALVTSVAAAWLIPAEALMNSTLVMLIIFGIGQWPSRRAAAVPVGPLPVGLERSSRGAPGPGGKTRAASAMRIQRSL